MNIRHFIQSIIFLYLLAIISCSPSLGAPWYPKSGNSTQNVYVYVSSIKIKNDNSAIDVEVNSIDPGYPHKPGEELSFEKATRFTVSVPFSKKTVEAEDLEIEVYKDASKETKIKVKCEIEGDKVPLVPGSSVSFILRVKDEKEEKVLAQKFISVTREVPQKVDLVLEEAEVLGQKVILNEEKTEGKADIPYSKGDNVSTGSVRAKFKVGDASRWFLCNIDGAVSLQEGVAVPVECKVEEKEFEYNAYSFKINCTRLAKTEDEDEPLKVTYLSVLQRDAGSGVVRVPESTTQITAGDIRAHFEVYDELSVVLQEDVVKLDSAGTAELIIKVPAKKGSYSEWSKVVHVVREETDSPDDPDEPAEPDPSEPDPGTPEPPVAEENPKDENGNEKFIIKTNIITEEIDPFDYYKENTNGFSADKFNSWIVNMTSITTDHVASYAFKEGEWTDEGDVATCRGDNIGEGQLNKTYNLKYWKYVSQEKRWKDRWAPPIDEKEKERRKRFLFFRFTGDTSVKSLDNSMFCVDTYTKFLFYYSDPANIQFIFGNGIPSDWRDYEEPTEGKHIHSDKPFYLTDPVGYVKEDGTCVLYSWVKSHIRASNYSATIAGHRNMATRKTGGAGYSPYKNVIKKVKKNKVKELNPLYTAKKPYIKKQPKDIYLSLDKGLDGVLEVEVDEGGVPEGEGLSYQWYKNQEPAVNEKAVAIAGANTPKYTLPKEVIDAYCYCMVTNKNTANNKEAKTSSHVVKVRIVQNENDLKVDAETPYITKHPKNVMLSILDNKAVKVSLSIDVKKPKDKGTLSYEWFKSDSEDTEHGRKIEGAKDKTYEFEISNAITEYYYCVVTNKNDNATGKKEVSAKSSPAKVEVEELFLLACNFVGKGTLTIFGTEDGKVVLRQEGEKQLRVKTGLDLVFIAKPMDDYKIKNWEGSVTLSENQDIAQMHISGKDDVKDAVTVYFEEIPKKGQFELIDISIQNESLGSGDASYPYAYFSRDIAIKFMDDLNPEHAAISRWSLPRNKISQNDDKLYVKGKGSSMVSIPNEKMQEISFYKKAPSLLLECSLEKMNDSGWFKFSPSYIQTVSSAGAGDIEFEYDTKEHYWYVKTKKADIKIENVTVDFDEGFKLKRGRGERKFIVSYDVNNPGNKAVGCVNVIYTFAWN